MNLKALVSAVAFSALSFGAQAVAIPATDSYTLVPGDIWYIATNTNSTDPKTVEIYTPNDGLATVTLVSTTEGGQSVTYALWEDMDPLLNNVTKGAAVPGTSGTYDDLVGNDVIPFFTFMMQAGQQYVLEISKLAGSASSNTQLSAVPLPGALWLFGSALLGFLGFSSRRKV